MPKSSVPASPEAPLTPPRGASRQDALWRAVLARDGGALGSFVYAVETTGIFCRAACPSRRPKRENVRFFSSPDEARRAGFRSCRRCRAGEPEAEADRVGCAVSRACAFMQREAGRIPSLRELADHTGLSAGYLQRRFKQRLGITPRAFAVALRDERLRARLRSGDTVTEALHAAGYGSASRFYERDSARLGVAPSAYRRGAPGAVIRYDVARCRLGRVLVAATDRGVCFVALGRTVRELADALRGEFPEADITRGPGVLGSHLPALVAFIDRGEAIAGLPLDVRGTVLQRRVWDALREIPSGRTATYAELAARVERPRAARAVASVCARNPTALVVPCHRVVRSDGGMGGYRWGVERKEALLEAEAAALPPSRRRRRSP